VCYFGVVIACDPASSSLSPYTTLFRSRGCPVLRVGARRVLRPRLHDPALIAVRPGPPGPGLPRGVGVRRREPADVPVFGRRVRVRGGFRRVVPGSSDLTGIRGRAYGAGVRGGDDADRGGAGGVDAAGPLAGDRARRGRARSEE